MKKTMLKNLAIFTFCASFASYVIAPGEEMESPVKSAQREHDQAERNLIEAKETKLKIEQAREMARTGKSPQNDPHWFDRLTEAHGTAAKAKVAIDRLADGWEKSTTSLPDLQQRLDQARNKLDNAKENDKSGARKFFEKLMRKASGKPDAGVSAVSFQPEAPQTESTWETVKKVVKSKFSKSSSADEDDYVAMNPVAQNY